MGFTTPCFIRKNTDNIRNVYLELIRFIHWTIMKQMVLKK